MATMSDDRHHPVMQDIGDLFIRRLRDKYRTRLKIMVQWIRMVCADDAVRKEIALNNLQRIAYAILFLAVIHLTVAVVMGTMISGEAGNGYLWRVGIIRSHLAGLAFVLLLALFIFFLKKSHSLTAGMINAILGMIFVWYLLLGAVITAVDQRVTSGITPYLVICVGLATFFVIRPLLAFACYFTGYAVFFFLLPYTQQNPEVLLSSRINGAVVTGIGICIILMIWKNSVVNLRQNQLIEQQTQALIKNNRQLAFLAAYDALTGLLTRRQFDLSVKHETDRMSRSQKTACIIIADIDHFKAVNDLYGHPQGDLVLKEVAAVIKAHLRTSDIAARWGGEEFILLLPETDEDGGGVVAEKLRQAIQNHVFQIGSSVINITISMGVSELNPREDDSFLSGYERADRALYLAKHKGRNRVELCDGWSDLTVKEAQAL